LVGSTDTVQLEPFRSQLEIVTIQEARPMTPMTLNADVFREVLRQVDCLQSQSDGLDLQIDGFDAESISQHVRLLRDAGHLEARTVINSDEELCKPVCLTFYGRDFLDAAIYDRVWDADKDVLREKGDEVTLNALSAALKSVACSLLSSP
jgi:hypothetical protein